MEMSSLRLAIRWKWPVGWCPNEEYVDIVVEMLTRNLEKHTMSMPTSEQDRTACCTVNSAVVLNTLCTVVEFGGLFRLLSLVLTFQKKLMRISPRMPEGSIVAADSYVGTREHRDS